MNLGEKIQLISTLSNLQSDRFFNKQDFCISELDKIENRMQYSFQPDRPKLELNLAHQLKLILALSYVPRQNMI